MISETILKFIKDIRSDLIISGCQDIKDAFRAQSILDNLRIHKTNKTFPTELHFKLGEYQLKSKVISIDEISSFHNDDVDDISTLKSSMLDRRIKFQEITVNRFKKLVNNLSDENYLLDHLNAKIPNMVVFTPNPLFDFDTSTNNHSVILKEDPIYINFINSFNIEWRLAADKAQKEAVKEIELSVAKKNKVNIRSSMNPDDEAEVKYKNLEKQIKELKNQVNKVNKTVNPKNGFRLPPSGKAGEPTTPISQTTKGKPQSGQSSRPNQNMKSSKNTGSTLKSTPAKPPGQGRSASAQKRKGPANEETENQDYVSHQQKRRKN